MVDIIAAVGAAQCIHIIILLFLRKTLAAREKVVFVWLMILCIHLTIPLMYQRQLLEHHAFLDAFNLSISFAQPGFLFFYFYAPVQRRQVVHFLPAFLFLIYFISPWKNDIAANVFNIFAVGAIPVYSIYILYDQFGFTQISSLKKIPTVAKIDGILLLGLALIWLTFLLTLLFKEFLPTGISLIYPSVTFFVYLIGFLQIGKRYTVQEVENQKYKNSALGIQHVDLLYKEVDQFMEVSKPFLNPELTLDQLSEQTGIKANQLSQIINSKTGKNFFDFVNQYRIREFLQLAQNQSSGKIRIMELAYQSGFNSKSTFNRAFQKAKGMSPTSYFAANGLLRE